MRVKIIASLGPSTLSEDLIRKLAEEGVAGFRINFAHSDVNQWKFFVEAVRAAEEKIRKPLTIIGDLVGSSIRIGIIDRVLTLKKGESAYIVLKDKASAENKEIPLPKKEIYESLELGDIIVMDDGRVKLKVVDVESSHIEVSALTDAVIKSKKGFTVMNKEFDIPPITDRDLENIDFAIKHDLDYVGLSYVRKRKDIELLRDILMRKNSDLGIIAKIETKSAVRNIKSIAESADVVLVARGDLGMNFGLEEVPHLQRLIVRHTLESGKPVIVATQLLESLIERPVPTRAEVVDVTVAVSEGVDALMLTGETAIGKYPIEAIKWLKRIVSVAEERAGIYTHRKVVSLKARYAKGVAELTEDLNAKLIIYSIRGVTARLISLLRPSVPFFVGSPSNKQLRKLNILWGIRPLQVPAESYEEGLEKTYEILRIKGAIEVGDLIVLTYGLRREEQVIKIRKVTT